MAKDTTRWKESFIVTLIALNWIDKTSGPVQGFKSVSLPTESLPSRRSTAFVFALKQI